MFQDLQREAQMIIDDVIRLSYFMRGAIPYEQMMHRTYLERQRVDSFISRHLKNESQKPYPQY